MARAVCYLELYPPAGILICLCLVVLVAVVVMPSGSTSGPTWTLLLIPIGLGGAFVALAHAGVICRWHPAVRAAVYLVFVGLGIAWAIWEVGR
jgi:hypothetical protein